MTLISSTVSGMMIDSLPTDLTHIFEFICGASNPNSGFISFIFRHLSRHLAPFLCSSIAFGYRIAKNGTTCHLICSESKQSKPRVQVSRHQSTASPSSLNSLEFNSSASLYLGTFAYASKSTSVRKVSYQVLILPKL